MQTVDSTRQRRHYEAIVISPEATPEPNVVDPHNAASFVSDSNNVNVNGNGKTVDGRRRSSGGCGPFYYHSSLMITSASRVFKFIFVAVILLFVLAKSRYWSYQRTSSDLKNLSDEVVALTRQLNADNEIIHAGQHELQETKLESAWDKQHVAELEETQKILTQNYQTETKAKEMEFKHSKLQHLTTVDADADRLELEREAGAKRNMELKSALKMALSDLAELRNKYPPAPEREHVLETGDNAYIPFSLEGVIVGENERSERKLKLRGQTPRHHTYQPGDSIEIIVTHRGPTTLHPGVISRVIKTPPGVVELGGPEYYYNIVKVQTGVTFKHVYDYQFRPYRTYPPGTKAYYAESPEIAFPITVEGYRNDAPIGFEVHGHYDITIDDENGGVLEQYAQVMMVYREIPIHDPENISEHGIYENESDL